MSFLKVSFIGFLAIRLKIFKLKPEMNTRYFNFRNSASRRAIVVQAVGFRTPEVQLRRGEASRREEAKGHPGGHAQSLSEERGLLQSRKFGKGNY